MNSRFVFHIKPPVKRLLICAYPFTVKDPHKAGECLPFANPSGCLGQELAVMLLIEEKVCPQYLHVYFDFSLPSYSSCFPFANPFGCLGHWFAVKEATLENF